ncbi:hypothetical protein ACFQ0M_07395 [Kitasatospora aburaviensis]
MRTVRSATRGIPALLATAALLGVAVPGPAAAAPPPPRPPRSP